MRISFFSPDEDSCINRRNVGKFLTCFYVFSASRAWLNLFIEVLASPKQKDWFRNVWVGPLDDFVCDSLLVISKDCVHYLTIAMVPKVQPVGQIRTEKDSNPTRELS